MTLFLQRFNAAFFRQVVFPLLMLAFALAFNWFAIAQPWSLTEKTAMTVALLAAALVWWRLAVRYPLPPRYTPQHEDDQFIFLLTSAGGTAMLAFPGAKFAIGFF